jgi:hypothetical protein
LVMGDKIKKFAALYLLASEVVFEAGSSACITPVALSSALSAAKPMV